MTHFPCPYLQGTVELTTERERHIAARHPDLLPLHRRRIAETLAAPGQVRRSRRFPTARLFSRWYADSRGGTHAVVVVVTEAAARRHWIVTAYRTRKLVEGETEWRKK